MSRQPAHAQSVDVMRNASMAAATASLVLGGLLPLVMAPASKSSPLMLAVSALLSLIAAGLALGLAEIRARLRDTLRSHEGMALLAVVALMAVSILWAHTPSSSLDQFMQFFVPLLSGIVLFLFFPPVAPRNRAFLWAFTLFITALVVTIDIRTGLNLRKMTGGRATDYSYNRTIVTLMLLVWPLLALIVTRREWMLLVLPLPLALAVWTGESGAAVLALLIGIVIFPIAWFMPVLAKRLGLVLVLLTLALSPFIGSLSNRVLSDRFHETLTNAHSNDRVNIWLSFEAAAQKRWLLGNGFGSSLNLQNGAVAKEVPPERVTLLGSSHPHNAFLQIWVELGLLGAALFAILALLLFRAVERAGTELQPFLISWIAVVSGIALVSHGAWQAWWIAGIAASAVGFATLDHESRQQKNDGAL